MENSFIKWLLDITIGAPIPVVLTLLATFFFFVKSATVSVLFTCFLWLVITDRDKGYPYSIF